MSAIQRNAVITGGGSGMGLGLAKELARRGVRVAVWDLHAAGAEAAAIAITKLGGVARGYGVDVASAVQVEKAAQAVAGDLGTVHIIVNSAGMATFGPISTTTEEIWDREIAVNLKGTFNCIKAVIPGMVESGWGRIVNIASLAGQAGVPQLAAYSAAKAGVIGLTKALAREFAGNGITCNCVSPGAIDTPMTRAAFRSNDLTFESARNQSPMGRLGTVDEIVAACLYFISDEAAFVTGQNLGVNGAAYI